MNLNLAKTDVDGYYKNTDTNSVINNNDNEYTAFLQNRERMKQIQNIQADIFNLKSEVKEIRDMCKKISERFNVNTDS